MIEKMIEKMSNVDGKKIVIFDIDETLNCWREIKDVKVTKAFTSARDAKNMVEVLGCWEEWNEELDNDVVNEEMRDLYWKLQGEGYMMVLLSARGIANIDRTVKWMEDNGITYDMMLLRPEHMESVGSGGYKDYMIEKFIGWENVVLGVDDSGSVLGMFEEKGVATVKVEVKKV